MNVKDLFPLPPPPSPLSPTEFEREPANLVMRLCLLAPVLCASRSASEKKRGKENIGASRETSSGVIDIALNIARPNVERV